MHRLLSIVAAAGLVGPALACGGDDSAVDPDAGTSADAVGGDAVIETCYRERDDRANGASPEATGLAFGESWVEICGQIDVDHPGGAFLDADQYEVAVTLARPAVLRLSAPGAATLDRLDLVVKENGARIAVGRVIGGFGIAVLPLAAGSYTIGVEALGSPDAPVPYQIAVIDDEPAMRCPVSAAPVDYREADESAAGHRANDVVAVRIAPVLLTQPTLNPNDQPETTGLAVSSGSRVTIAGTSAGVEPVDDTYRDRDTFAVYTGQGTNLLEVRAVWPGAVADLDVFAFEAERAEDAMGRPVQLLTGELLVTAVKPSTLYWIWVGGAPGSQLPAGYSLSICGHEVGIGSAF